MIVNVFYADRQSSNPKTASVGEVNANETTNKTNKKETYCGVYLPGSLLVCLANHELFFSVPSYCKKTNNYIISYLKFHARIDTQS